MHFGLEKSTIEEGKMLNVSSRALFRTKRSACWRVHYRNATQNSPDSIHQMAIPQAACCKIFLCIECYSADDCQIAILHLVILPSQPLAHNANPARYAAARKITHINF